MLQKWNIVTVNVNKRHTQPVKMWIVEIENPNIHSTSEATQIDSIECAREWNTVFGHDLRMRETAHYKRFHCIFVFVSAFDLESNASQSSSAWMWWNENHMSQCVSYALCVQSESRIIQHFPFRNFIFVSFHFTMICIIVQRTVDFPFDLTLWNNP